MKRNRLQYFFKNPECKARTADLNNCICWHDAMTGPKRNIKFGSVEDDLKWRIVKK